MSRIVTILVALILFVISTPARAMEYEWGGVQISTTLSTSQPLGEKMALRVALSDFWVPSQDSRVGFLYLGPMFSLGDSEELAFWISPQVVGVFGWFKKDGIGPSLMFGLKKGDTSFFVEMDGVISADGSENMYYGYYALTQAVGPTTFGLQAEQVDFSLGFGPQMGFGLGGFSMNLQGFLTPKGVTNLRVGTNIAF